VRPRHRWEDNIRMDFQEVGGGCGDTIIIIIICTVYHIHVGTNCEQQLIVSSECIKWCDHLRVVQDSKFRTWHAVKTYILSVAKIPR
jgi:hypothetical protein